MNQIIQPSNQFEAKN